MSLSALLFARGWDGDSWKFYVHPHFSVPRYRYLRQAIEVCPYSQNLTIAIEGCFLTGAWRNYCPTNCTGTSHYMSLGHSPRNAGGIPPCIGPACRIRGVAGRGYRDKNDDIYSANHETTPWKTQRHVSKFTRVRRNMEIIIFSIRVRFSGVDRDNLVKYHAERVLNGRGGRKAYNLLHMVCGFNMSFYCSPATESRQVPMGRSASSNIMARILQKKYEGYRPTCHKISSGAPPYISRWTWGIYCLPGRICRLFMPICCNDSGGLQQ